MPTALIKKLAKENNLNTEELEDLWARAKNIADTKFSEKDSRHWPYVMGVFKRLVLNKYGVEVSESSVDVLSHSGSELVFDDGSPEAWSETDSDDEEEDEFVSESARTSQFDKDVKANQRKFAADVKAGSRKFKDELSGKSHAPKAPTPKAKKTSGRQQAAVKNSRERMSKKADLPNWWLKLSENGRKTYLGKHPASKFASAFKKMTKEEQRKALKTKAPANHSKVNVKQHDAEIEEQPSEVDGITNAEPQRVIPDEADHTGKAPDPHEEDDEEDELKTPSRNDSDEDEEQKRFIDYHPGDHDVALKQRVREYGHNAVRKAQHAYRTTRHAVKMGIMKEKHGLKSIDKMLRGRKLNDDEKAGAKRVAKHAGILLLGGLAAAAMFTPLGPFAQVIGDEFFNHVKGFFTGNSESSVSVSATDEEFSDDETEDSRLDRSAAKLSDTMYEWLMSQDPQKLAEQLARKYPQYAQKDE